MAYVITAVGAGGKTTYLRQRAQDYLRQGKKVAITTTTHIWPPHPTLGTCCAENATAAFLQSSDRKDVDRSGKEDRFLIPDGRTENDGEAVPPLVYIGVLEKSGKLGAPDPEEYERICREYDVVLVEGDGSHCMPAKIPSALEPVIPDNSDEIAVIMGAHAVGRRIDVVCHRYQGCSKEKLDARTLEELARQHYLNPLRRRYPKAKVFYVLSRMPVSHDTVAGVVMASGFGRRYGSNKLLDLYEGKPLYLHTLNNVQKAIGTENTVVVTQYEKIMEQVRERGMECVMNEQAAEGIAASIRLGTQKALDRGVDAVLFFAADMPCLPAEEIRMYVSQFLASGKSYGCMVFGQEHTCTNPGAFRLDKSAEKLLHLTGDRGAMRIMKQEPWDVYYYQIAPEYAQDIDTAQ